MSFAEFLANELMSKSGMNGDIRDRLIEALDDPLFLRELVEQKLWDMNPSQIENMLDKFKIGK